MAQSWLQLQLQDENTVDIFPCTKYSSICPMNAPEVKCTLRHDFYMEAQLCSGRRVYQEGESHRQARQLYCL